jgi:hypothetical protein
MRESSLLRSLDRIVGHYGDRRARLRLRRDSIRAIGIEAPR